uniref:Ovule protein n=1 Tax=Caenorhabditis tropicalis TaxID=1561998 RepID=A0A1I7UGJ7_9PELO
MHSTYHWEKTFGIRNEGCITIFHILFLFNPWIAKSQKYAEKFYVDAHYTEKLHYIFFYCWVVVAAFICWLPWKNQSKRERPTYKVIYGDEDSVTKKMLNEKLV